MKSEVVFELPTVSHGKSLGTDGSDCGEEGGEMPGGKIVLAVEAVAGVRKERRRCARKVVGVCNFRVESA